MTREQINEKAVSLSKIYNNLLLEHCTGLGKTKSALDIASELSGRGYIILSETAHIKNWHEEIVKHKKEDILLRSEMFLYASLHKYKNTKIDWIILDEAHHLSELRLKILSTIVCKNAILLTATLDSSHRKMIEFKRFKNLHRYYIPLEKGIEWEIIPEPEIYLISIELSKIGRSETFVINKGLAKKRIKKTCGYNERWNYLKKYKDIELTVECTQQEKADYLDESIDYWKDRFMSERMDWLKNKWLNTASQRKRFIAEIKTPHVNELILGLNREKKRYICFTGSISQCEILGSNNNIVHSKNKKNNQDIIDSFNSDKLHSLFAVGMLQEGVNLYDIEVGVIVQLDGKLRAYTQKSGRIFRGAKPVQYIFYTKNTRDEEYLNNALQGLEKYIKNQL